jgi:hypothetical protein
VEFHSAFGRRDQDGRESGTNGRLELGLENTRGDALNNRGLADAPVPEEDNFLVGHRGILSGRVTGGNCNEEVL